MALDRAPLSTPSLAEDALSEGWLFLYGCLLDDFRLVLDHRWSIVASRQIKFRLDFTKVNLRLFVWIVVNAPFVAKNLFFFVIVDKRIAWSATNRCLTLWLNVLAGCLGDLGVINLYFKIIEALFYPLSPHDLTLSGYLTLNCTEICLCGWFINYSFLLSLNCFFAEDSDWIVLIIVKLSVAGLVSQILLGMEYIELAWQIVFNVDVYCDSFKNRNHCICFL